ncbi:MAG: YkgJ family cysteine cluster protein [Candidatus Eremiobacteraeota bacterium]|nr:YkgJ family cysteine cluster protein [Candidatus Eremiobacteraeota bacterium]
MLARIRFAVDEVACSSCNGSCCLDVVVGITGYDAWRIAKARGLRFDEFVAPATADAGGLGAFRFGDGYAALMLQKEPREQRACFFLEDGADGKRRCGTYPARPYVCRVYPMTLRNGCIDLRTDVACAPGAWDMAALDRSMWKCDFDRYDYEWQLYARVVAAWNAASLDGLPAYYRFVHAAFEAIDPVLQTASSRKSGDGGRPEPGSNVASVFDEDELRESIATRIDEILVETIAICGNHKR